MSRKRVVLALLALCFSMLGVGILVACNEAPTNVAVRTFERAQRMDVVCLQLFDHATGQAISPRPLPQEQCAPVASGVNGGGLDNQLFALVTQSTRGELAVVNLSAGFIQDLSRATPGINFLPVGALPTDVAATPDGEMAFVGSAEPNKAAIYGVTSRRIIGDFAGFPVDPDGPVGLTSWPVCALPQTPGALAVVPRRAVAGAEGGADPFPYELVAVLTGDRRNTAKIVTIDPRPFLRAVELPKPTTPAQSRFGDGPILPPGSLAPCPITSAIELSGKSAIPPTFRPGPRWADGIPYVDGGVDLSCDQPPSSATCGPPTCGCGAAVVDGGDAGVACTPPGEPDAGDVALDLGPLDDPRLVAAALDDQMLYVADANLPLVHAIDLSSPGNPVELPPFLATSLADPSRIIAVSAVAVSPPTRDFKRYLYAVDRDQGSLLVYEITDPKTALRTPMRRPHPELDPFQPEDRISFGTPAVAVSFARHDFPLSRIRNAAVPNARTGLLCNPNALLDPVLFDGGAGDPNAPEHQNQFGYFYRNDQNDPAVALGPRRLRGIFAFATLANGQIVAIDVDDWDAPCRRPQFLSVDPSPSKAINGDAGEPLNPLGSLAAREPGPTDGDFDPYHSPITFSGATSEEITFPISAPHRIRADSFIKTNSQTGNRVPRLDGIPKIQSNGAPLPYNGTGSEHTPLVLPANASKPDPKDVTSALGVQFANEVPEVHSDQDWTVTYEGNVPGFDGISATLTTPDAYASLVFTQPNARFCAKGVEDWDRGRERAASILAELQKNGVTPPDARLDRHIVDYVQLTEDLLPPDDGYWGLAEDPNDPNHCWDPALATAAKRYDACFKTFGSAADQGAERDFPILEAYADRVVVGAFAPDGEGTRDVVYKDVGYNASRLKLAKCCFHHQARFHVRTGGMWSLIGFIPGESLPGIGFLSHLTQDGAGRCVPSCDPREALLNSRAPAVPSGVTTAPGRNSPLALRNPLLSFWMLDGLDNTKPPPRDAIYEVHTRGAYSALTINLAASTVAVSPQSMRFIETLGQIAVVDAASQGLVLIDLGGVTIAHAPYF